jgi:hypothetical protein
LRTQWIQTRETLSGLNCAAANGFAVADALGAAALPVKSKINKRLPWLVIFAASSFLLQFADAKDCNETPAVVWEHLVAAIRTGGVDAAQAFRGQIISFEGGALGKQTRTTSKRLLNPRNPKDSNVYCDVRFNQPMNPWFAVFSVRGRVRSIIPAQEVGKSIITVEAIEAIRRRIQ